MRGYKIALFGVIAILACLARASKPTDSKLMAAQFLTVVDSLMDNQDTIPTKRLKTWLLKNKTGAQVLDKLKLGGNIATALANTKLNSLRKYTNMFNKKNPNSKISVIGILTARYGDDKVAKALVSAQEKAATMDTAKLLRSEQLDSWLISDKSVVDVFKLLKLSDNGYEALTSRKLEVLEDYIRTQTKARELEAALLQRWRHRNLQPGKVLKVLKLDGNVEHVLKSRRLEALTKYIPMYNKMNNPVNQVSLLGVLTAHYSDDAVAKAIAAARRNPATEEIATKLQSQQLEGWLKSGKSADDVFVLLKLKEDGPAGIGSPQLDTLDEYIKLLNTQKSGDESVIKALVTGFGGESNLMSILTTAKANTQAAVEAEKLETALLTQLRNENFQPERVFKLLKLDRDVDDVLGSTNLPILMKYISAFNKDNPTHEVSLLGMLKAHYSDDMVAKAIVTAKRNRATKEMAMKLQTQQLEEWLNSGKSVNDVSRCSSLKKMDWRQLLVRRWRCWKILEAGKNRGTRTKATKLQSAQFSQWLEEGLDSMSVLTNVFKVKEEDLGGASGMQRSVAKQFQAFYEDNMGALNAVIPRRVYTDVYLAVDQHARLRKQLLRKMLLGKADHIVQHIESLAGQGLRHQIGWVHVGLNLPQLHRLLRHLISHVLPAMFNVSRPATVDWVRSHHERSMVLDSKPKLRLYHVLPAKFNVSRPATVDWVRSHHERSLVIDSKPKLRLYHWEDFGEDVAETLSVHASFTKRTQLLLWTGPQ
ncbi:unnamed protein product [Phytophthora fragariaefolia]|uniref:Unnamed protein product n=1 Tax=Phytophthora fragariaefolia TaxID=1490495 RepID=A0A9W7D2S4_9STRA|nr:unnamed protein product [Phytophthora fragariaefolia]